jgi:hypothetical protein
MITVPEEDNSQQTTSADNNVLPEADANDMNSKRSGSRGSMLDDSIRSNAENSLVHKMTAVLNEESWWNSSKRSTNNSSPPPETTTDPPIKTLVLSDNDNKHTKSSKTNKVKSKRAGCIFGIILLTVGFVIGGVFIHRQEIMMEMNSLLRGGGGSANKAQAQGGAGEVGGEGTRQLPIVQHTMTYEERQQLYRMQRQAGMLRPIGGGQSYGIDEHERMKYQNYYGFDQQVKN